MPRHDRRTRRPNLPQLDADGRPYPPIRHDDLPAGIVLARLLNVRERGRSEWSACCPAHPDVTPSLSLAETDGRVLLVHCHAGCDTKSVMAAIGLTAAFLFPTDHALRCAGDTRPRPAAGPRPAEVDSARWDTKVLDDLAWDYSHAPGAAERVTELASEIGVDAGVLRRLGVGWDARDGRWSVPERHDTGGVVGIGYRWPMSGGKYFCSGGSRGLIFARGLGPDAGPIYVPEGMSDAAALLTFGCAAVGRPMAATPTTVAHWLPLLLARHGGGHRREVIVVGDRDPAGIAGARTLAERLNGSLGSALAATASGPSELAANTLAYPVRWALPRSPHKDVRAQYLACGDPTPIVEED